MAPVSAPADRIIAARLPHDLIVRLRAAARLSDRTLSGQIRRVLREWAESDQRDGRSEDAE